MRTNDLFKAVLVTFLFLVLIFVSWDKCAAAKVMYDNTIDEYAWWPPLYDDCVEALDYGISGKGEVGRFIFGYVTTKSNPGRIKVRFYRSTDYETCPGNYIRTFIFDNLPGSPYGFATFLTKEVILPEDQTFNLFDKVGYSFEFDNDDTGVWLARGGAGNDDSLWGCFDRDFGIGLEHKIGSYDVKKSVKLFSSEIGWSPTTDEYGVQDRWLLKAGLPQ